MRSAFWLPAAIAIATSAVATEVTVQNDSLMAGDNGAIQAGFVAGEKAAAWLTSPCDGNIVAAQIYWQSLNGNTTDEIEDSIDIYRSAAYPEPGALAEQILGPVLTDGFINEYRYLDEDNTIPLSVPVVQDETFVVALTFLQAPDPTQGPSVVNDLDGIQPNSNAIYASLGGGQFAWFPNSTLGVFGDWVIRAVVELRRGIERSRCRRKHGRELDAVHSRRTADVYDHSHECRPGGREFDDGRGRLPGRVHRRELDLHRPGRCELPIGRQRRGSRRHREPPGRRCGRLHGHRRRRARHDGHADQLGHGRGRPAGYGS